jgi:hypothetical protein
MKKLLWLLILVATVAVAAPRPTQAQECSDTAPVGSPTISRIDRNSASATLHVTPAGVPYTEYVVSYGFSEGDERFGVTFPQESTDSELTYTIDSLDPNLTYYFKIRAGNNCQPGQWSAWYASNGTTGSTANAAAGSSASSPTSLPVTGTPSYLLFLSFLIPVLFIFAGVLL